MGQDLRSRMCCHLCQLSSSCTCIWVAPAVPLLCAAEQQNSPTSGSALPLTQAPPLSQLAPAQAVSILENFFDVEEGEVENLAPRVDAQQGTYSFGAPQQNGQGFGQSDSAFKFGP